MLESRTLVTLYTALQVMFVYSQRVKREKFVHRLVHNFVVAQLVDCVSLDYSLIDKIFNLHRLKAMLLCDQIPVPLCYIYHTNICRSDDG